MFDLNQSKPLLSIMVDISKDIFVKDYMLNNPPFLAPDHSLKSAIEFMRSRDLRHIPILREHEVLGILSYGQLQKYSLRIQDYSDQINDNLLEQLNVEQLMCRKFVALRPYTTIHEAGVLMQYLDIHALPVLDKGELVGLVNSNDLIQAILQTKIDKP